MPRSQKRNPPEPLSDPEPAGGAPAATGRRRVRRGILIAGFTLLGLLIVALSAFLLWANDTYAVTPDGFDSVQEDPRLSVDDQGDAVVMGPAEGGDGGGLVFFAGAKVEPQAYAPTFQELTAEGTTVVIIKPFLNLAILERRPWEDFTALAPDIENWSVGGHSMGGVRACTYAEDAEVRALILLASYCSLGDLSDRDDLAALTVTGTQDELVAEEDLRSSLALMPPGAQRVDIEGATHAQFGDYGPQRGDGNPTISDDEARALTYEAIGPFLTSLDE